MLCEFFRLFPRNIGRGRLEEEQLKTLKHQCAKLLGDKTARDMSSQLAGRLDTQIEIPLSLPVAVELQQRFAQSCLHWIQESKRNWDKRASELWEDDTFGIAVYELWLNKQVAGDYNPVHIHGGDFSGVLYVQVPEQIDGSDHGGALGIHGPECFDPVKMQMGMMQYFKPVEGDFYVFPAWQPHSVMPFKGEGERWSIAFNAQVVRPQMSQ